MPYQNYGDFGLYAKSSGISSLNLDYHTKKIESNMTPYVIEERQLNVTQIDVFSRLLMNRIIWVAGEVNDMMAIIVQAQLMFLDSNDRNDITMHIDSPGGGVKSGLSMVDVMEYIHSDIITVNTGMAASMGSILLGAGAKGKRCSLRYSKTMLHQSSGGVGGNIQDAEIEMIEWKKENDILFDLLGRFCNKTPQQVKEDAKRNLWLSAEDALSYGIIDEIIVKKQN